MKKSMQPGRPNRVYMVKNLNTGNYIKSGSLKNIAVWTNKKDAIAAIRREFSRGTSEYEIEEYDLIAVGKRE